MSKRLTLALAVGVLGIAAPPAVAQLSTPPAPIESYDGDPGRVGDPATWRTPEFLRDIGMVTIGAEFAYAKGYSANGMNIGVVDSGTFAGHVREHGSKDTNYAVGDRFFSVEAQGGETGPTSGFYNPAYNDTHGTHVSGTIGASRDGVGQTTPEENMHGVAFNVDLYMGNTAKTDGVFYGLLPPTATLEQRPDNAYIGNVYRAVNAANTANGKKIRLITTSWGSQPTTTEYYGTLEPRAGDPPSFGLNAGFRFLSTPEGVADPNGNTSHWLNGAIETARTGTILQFTAGNSGYANPTPRGAAPYYLPDLEGRWYTTSGLDMRTQRTLNADGSVDVPGAQEFNQCGVAKWSCLTAPSRQISSTVVQIIDDVPQPRYQAFNGTSMAGPHSAAALTLIMQRFPYMTNPQALYTMFTTGRQNATIGVANPAVPNPDAGKIVQVPDARNGWGTVDLRAAMKGPGQLLGPVDVDTQGYSDVWSNDISDVAIRARQGEDTAEAAAWAQTKTDRGWTNGLPANATEKDKFDFDVGTRREAARNARVYDGSLTKRGDGTLFLTGADTWHGKSTVSGGKLSVIGSHASAVDATGGTLGGSGSVAGNVDVASGTLAPGVSAAEAARITDVPVSAGNVLSVGGNLRFSSTSRLSVSARSGTDYTRVRADGDVTISGQLALDVQGTLTPGTSLTLVRGRSLTGTFTGLPQGGFFRTGGRTFVISYLDNAVTLIVAATADGTVGGTVPPTLTLTMGPAASFPEFIPGLAKDYTASTTATVISSAGNATLTVADPSPTNTGHLVNGTHVLPQALQAGVGTAFAPVGGTAAPTLLKSWTAPTTNEIVTVNFKQPIAATDPLRTGTYSKTLTFTLSTTNP